MRFPPRTNFLHASLNRYRNTAKATKLSKECKIPFERNIQSSHCSQPKFSSLCMPKSTSKCSSNRVVVDTKYKGYSKLGLGISVATIGGYCFLSGFPGINERLVSGDRSFSNSALKASLPSKKKRQNRIFNWKVLARSLKSFRIPFMVASVYGIGYQQGIIDYASDPKGQERKLLQSVMGDYGVRDPSTEVQTLKDNDKSIQSFIHYFVRDSPKANASKDSRLVRVSSVGTRIVKSASKKVETLLTDGIQKKLDELPKYDPTDADKMLELVTKIVAESEEIQFWLKALNRIEGTWEFVLIDSKLANAFVSEVFPKKIFITTGLFDEFIENDDELGLVLGHEISHMILAHNSQKNQIELFLRAFEILLLSLDPTDGIWSLSFMAFLGGSRKLLSQAFSRENENQADEFGIEVSARACFDTKRGAYVFQKMHQKSMENKLNPQRNSFSQYFSSHPTSKERYEFLFERSEIENRSKYKDSECKSIQNTFQKMFRNKKEVNYAH